MNAKQKRLRFLIGCIAVMGIATAIILASFRDNLVFFFTPTQWQEKIADEKFDRTREVRVGGLVKKDSVKNLKNGGIVFIITDLTNDMKVTYKGFVPSLFREGQGVVAQGMVNEKGRMTARTILAKHDEKYMPKEVVDALKASGRWEEAK